MRKLIALALALVALTACRTETQQEQALACNPQWRSCHLRYAIWPQAPHGLAVALPGTVLEQALAAGPAQGIEGASNAVVLSADYEHAEEAQIADVVDDVASAAKAGRWWLVGTLCAFLALLALRKLAPVGGKLEVWLHTTTGLWLWGTGLAILGQAILTLAGMSVMDLKTFGGVLATAATTVLLAKVKDSTPSAAAQSVKAAKAGGSLAAG